MGQFFLIKNFKTKGVKKKKKKRKPENGPNQRPRKN